MHPGLRPAFTEHITIYIHFLQDTTEFNIFNCIPFWCSSTFM